MIDYDDAVMRFQWAHGGESVDGVGFPPEIGGARRVSFSSLGRPTGVSTTTVGTQVIEESKSVYRKKMGPSWRSMARARFPRALRIPRISIPVNTSRIACTRSPPIEGCIGGHLCVHGNSDAKAVKTIDAAG